MGGLSQQVVCANGDGVRVRVADTSVHLRAGSDDEFSSATLTAAEAKTLGLMLMLAADEIDRLTR